MADNCLVLSRESLSVLGGGGDMLSSHDEARDGSHPIILGSSDLVKDVQSPNI